MGRVDPASGLKKPKTKKPKSLIELKREEQKAKKLLPRPPRPAPTSPKPRDPNHIPRPKPMPQNPGSQKLMALFKREITMIETHLKHGERFRQHWRAEIDKMEEPEKGKWESGEVGNYVRLLRMMERSREILMQAREMSAWIVPKSKLGLNKNLPGMKEFVLGAEEKKNAEGANGKPDGSSEDEDDPMDTDEDESGNAAPAGFIPLNIVNKAPKASRDTADKGEDKSATEPAEPNPFFVVDTEPTPVNLNGTSKKSKKRAKEDDGEGTKTAKKAKKEKPPIVVPQSEPEAATASKSEPEPASASDPKPKSSKFDFSAIETQLQAEIEAGIKAKEEREKAKAEAKLGKKAKKRKRLSEGDSEKEVKKVKKDDLVEGKEAVEKKKRKAEGSGDEEVLSDEGGKKKHKAAA